MQVTERQRLDLVTSFANGRRSAIEVRQALGEITYGELFRMVADAGLSLPVPSRVGREEELERARRWMFPNSTARTEE